MAQPFSIANVSIGNQNKILSFISKKELEKLVLKHKADEQVTKLFAINILRLYLTSFLSFSTLSLRRICSLSGQLWLQLLSGLDSIKRTSLSKRNKALPFEFFKDVFELLRTKVNARMTKRNPLFKQSQELNIFDSTFINLSLKLFPWALRHCNERGVFKLGLRIQDGFDIPNHVVIQTESTNENDIFKQFIDLTKKAITYIFDRGFYKISTLKEIVSSFNFFITRCHPQYKVTPLEKPSNACCEDSAYRSVKEQRVLIGSGRNQLKTPLRLIKVRAKKKNKTITFLTNRVDLKAHEVADLYLKRWQIEPLFKWLKQSLKINKFISRSLNGVMIQIYVALILQLLLTLFRESCKKAFSNRIELLREMRNQFWNHICLFFFRFGLACSSRYKINPPLDSLKRIVKERIESGGH